MFKKITAILLVAVLSFSMLACGNKVPDVTPEEVVDLLIPKGADVEKEQGMAVYSTDKSFQETYRFLDQKTKEEMFKVKEEGLSEKPIVMEDGEEYKEWAYIGMVGRNELPVIISLVGNKEISNVIVAVGEEAATALLSIGQ